MLAWTGCAPSVEDSAAPGAVVLEAEEGMLSTLNSAGRTGSWFLPSREDGQALPLVVAYHGTGGAGASMVTLLRDEAESWGVALLAPDSRQSPNGDWTWEVGNRRNEVTEDYEHTLACIDEFLPLIELDEAEVLAVGFSGGGSSAPYIASNETFFTAFGILHGGVVRGGLGEHLVPGWLSTGEEDTMRPPDELESDAEYLQERGFVDLEVRTYPGGHSLSEAERSELFSWWLTDL